jgi:hypothetical protein
MPFWQLPLQGLRLVSHGDVGSLKITGGTLHVAFHLEWIVSISDSMLKLKVLPGA